MDDLEVVSASKDRHVLADDVTVTLSRRRGDLKCSVGRVDPVRLIFVAAQWLWGLQRRAGKVKVEVRSETERLSRFSDVTGGYVETQEGDDEIDADGEDKQATENEEASTEATTD